jgi:dephospho-CoA kinase
MIIVGLTGAIASGKSTVLQMFKNLGAVTISSDQLIHLLQQKDTEQTKALVKILGKDILLDDGRVDRKALADKIVKDPTILKLLEQLYYPTLKAMFKKLIKTAQEANQKMVVIEIPLLFEGGFQNLVDTTVVCSCTDEESLKRALSRANADETKIQTLNKFRLKNKDLVLLAKNIINTNVEIEKTQTQVVLMFADLLTMESNVWPLNWSAIEDI